MRKYLLAIAATLLCAPAYAQATYQSVVTDTASPIPSGHGIISNGTAVFVDGGAPSQKSLAQYNWSSGDILPAVNNFIAACNASGNAALLIPAGIYALSGTPNPTTGNNCSIYGVGPATIVQPTGTFVQFGDATHPVSRQSLHDLTIQYTGTPTANTPAIYAMSVTDYWVYNIKFVTAGTLEVDGSATTRATRGYHWGWTGDYNQGTADNCNIQITNASADHYWGGTLSGSVTSGSPTAGAPICVQPLFNGTTPGLADTYSFRDWWMQATSAGTRANAPIIDATQGNVNNGWFDGDVFDWSGTNGFDVKCAAFSVATSAATASGSVLTFSAVPASWIVGMYLYDTTTGSVIATGAQIQSMTSTIVTMTSAVTGGGVLNGDTIVAGGVGYIHNLDILHTRVTPGTNQAITLDYNCASTANGIDAENVHIIGPKLLSRDGANPIIIKQAHDGGTTAYTNATIEDADIMTTGTATAAAVEVGASGWYLKSGLVGRYGGTGASPNITNLLQVDGSPSILVGKWQIPASVNDNSGQYSTQQQVISVAINGAQTANTTKYYSVNGWMSSVSANENVVGQMWGAGALSIPSVCGSLATAPSAGQTEIFTIRIAGATPSNPITCTFSGTSTAGVGTGGPNIVTDGQLIDWQAVQSTTSASASPTVRAFFGHQ